LQRNHTILLELHLGRDICTRAGHSVARSRGVDTASRAGLTGLQSQSDSRRTTMKTYATLIGGIVVAAMASLVGGAPTLAATFVYVANAEDGDIGVYRMLDSGELQPGARVKA